MIHAKDIALGARASALPKMENNQAISSIRKSVEQTIVDSVRQTQLRKRIFCRKLFHKGI